MREREGEREIKHIATGTYPQPQGWTTPSSSWRAPGWWRWPLVMDTPYDRVPEQGPSWVLVATKACGGGTPDLGLFLGVSIFIGIFGVKNKSGGVHESTTRAESAPIGVGCAIQPYGWLGTLLAQLFCFGGFFWSIKITINFQLIWTPFDIPFL